MKIIYLSSLVGFLVSFLTALAINGATISTMAGPAVGVSVFLVLTSLGFYLCKKQ